MGSKLHLADSFLAQQHGLEVAKQAAADSFEFIAKSNPYNPVARYLLKLKSRTVYSGLSYSVLAVPLASNPPTPSAITYYRSTWSVAPSGVWNLASSTISC